MTRDATPLISVVMPCYNGERYIAEAIRSIISQGIESVQIVVVDDGSTDCSADIVRSFANSVEYRSQANAGIAAARNSGVALARGKYLTFLDADDIWTPGSLLLRLQQLRGGTECVFGGVESFFSPDLSEAERERLGPIPPPMTGRLTGTMLIERRAFDRVGIFDASLKIGEMFDWVARAEQAKVATVLIDDIVMRRRVHSNNTTTRLKGENRDYLKALRASLARRRETALKPDTSA